MQIYDFGKYYNQGLNDQEIAEATGADITCVFRWRRSRRLPPMEKKNRGSTLARAAIRQPRKPSTMDRLTAVAAEARRQGMTYGEYTTMLRTQAPQKAPAKRRKKK